MENDCDLNILICDWEIRLLAHYGEESFMLLFGDKEIHLTRNHRPDDMYIQPGKLWWHGKWGEETKWLCPCVLYE